MKDVISRSKEHISGKTDEKEEIVRMLIVEMPHISRDSISHAFDRCSQIIPAPRHRKAFLQTIRWYINSIENTP